MVLVFFTNTSHEVLLFGQESVSSSTPGALFDSPPPKTSVPGGHATMPSRYPPGGRVTVGPATWTRDLKAGRPVADALAGHWRRVR